MRHAGLKTIGKQLGIAWLSCLLAFFNQGCGTEVGNGYKKESKQERKQAGTDSQDKDNDVISPAEAAVLLSDQLLILFNNCSSPFAEDFQTSYDLVVTDTASSIYNRSLNFETTDSVRVATDDQKTVNISYKADPTAAGGVGILASTASDNNHRSFTCGLETTDDAAAIKNISGVFTQHTIVLTDTDGVEKTLDWYVGTTGSTTVKLARVVITSGETSYVFTNTEYHETTLTPTQLR